MVNLFRISGFLQKILKIQFFFFLNLVKSWEKSIFKKYIYIHTYIHMYIYIYIYGIIGSREQDKCALEKILVVF